MNEAVQMRPGPRPVHIPLPAQQHAHTMPFGATVRPHGDGVDFRLWAPAAGSVELALQPPGGERVFLPTERDLSGWHSLHVPDAAAGWRYRWRIDGGVEVPDPASRFNPDGVHAEGRVEDPAAFAWRGDWRGRPWHEVVLYEMHVGSFTPEGTYAAARRHLPALAALGVTALQLMPLADFPGRFGWGYDGVLPFAPHASYGEPDELKRFIQAAHDLGLAVMLDVVYNHFGPDGNYLHCYAPTFFSPTHQTAWGAALNFDQPGSETVREFFIHNALYWLGEYQFDGLRFDAVHAMLDDSRPDIMATLSERARAAFPQRHVHLVLENDSNDAERLALPATPGRFDGQWNGDFHHPVHVLLTGETDGYYGEYAPDTLPQLARALTHGLVWTGGPHNSAHALPRRRMPDGVTVPLGSMVNFLQNHDQVGNRAFGERLAALVDEAPLRLVTALMLLHPGTPMLFMGEEWGSTQPFQYFCDWEGELKEAVTQGRRKEFAQFPRFSDPEAQHRIPDPCDVETLRRCQLDPAAEAATSSGKLWRAFYGALLQRRRERLMPRLPTLSDSGHEAALPGGRVLSLRWRFESGPSLRAVLNLGAEPAAWPVGQRLPAHVLWREGPVTDAGLGPWSGVWWEAP
jgi:maltooligosyltrehalose trehalohydrolase